ncbi:serine--tRNA ligase [Patescibacteria group bacterium]|nr:serine--tRNA ligase [Patescibacteria group bacterium]MBU1663601.1 serine--tRNA ligase [Patescibacteria group bacterium]MBU1933914.1 serine--tRNA ligase [Patescibacteria group bacterium]MBU2007655.1 serine--tRNA ligase [Patescibacteria group bacterium]MBU2233850.1 serine--tRNA ligase [Patescibacteria group bacterium]
MLDIKFIRANVDIVKQAVKNKNLKIDVNELLKVDENRKKLQGEIDSLRTQKNELAEAGKKNRPTDEQIKRGKAIKEKIIEIETEFKLVDEKYKELMWQTPQIPCSDAPLGQDETDNVEVKKWGKIKKFAFPIKDHLELGKNLDILDVEKGAKVGGYRGYYLKNEGVLLHLGLMMFAMEKMVKNGFKPFIPPTIIREFAMYGSGHFPFGKDDIYQIINSGKLADGSNVAENKYLVGTSEPSILAYHADEILNETELPKKYCGFSQCYRSEIGSYGKDTRGIYRIHEFMKIEQVIFCKNDYKESEKLHQEITAISEEILKDMEIPYRILDICTGDMGAGKYRMFDLESWMPSRNSYGETHSSSNLGDWQARRLNIKYQQKDGQKLFVHTLNNTAIASPRILIAILENNQQADGSIVVPKVLRKYLPGKIKIIRKK